jgi:hypothetical protein
MHQIHKMPDHISEFIFSDVREVPFQFFEKNLVSPCHQSTRLYKRVHQPNKFKQYFVK